MIIMDRKRCLYGINAMIAGVLTIFGLQSCDKGDVEEPCMYGPPPPETTQSEPSSYSDVDDIVVDSSLEIDVNSNGSTGL